MSVQAAEIRGRVTDGQSGQPLARVQVRCVGGPQTTQTDSEGRFAFDDGNQPCHLRVAAVGYDPASQTAKAGSEIEIVLLPDTLRKSESVQVSSTTYADETPEALNLAGGELRNLSSVLADDPLRAVQGLPGVTAQNDFQSQFALRGAGSQRIGIVMDGILLHSPFHFVPGDASGASVSSIQGDTLEAATLYPGPLPSKFGDATAGVLDLQTRDGGAGGAHWRLNAGMADVGGSGEGVIDDKGTWLVSTRQSYLQYLINLTSTEPGLAFAYRDIQAKFTYNLTARNWFSLTVMDNNSSVGQAATAASSFNTLSNSGEHNTTAIATWRFTPASDLLITNRAAFIRENYEDDNKAGVSIEQGYYSEWVWNGDVSRRWGTIGASDVGASFREMRDDGSLYHLYAAPQVSQQLDLFHGNDGLWSVYGQHAWRINSRFRLEAGVRATGHALSSATPILPYGSLTAELWHGARLSASWAGTSQFPDLSQLSSSVLGRPSLLPERSMQTQVTFQQLLGESTRLRVDVYNRQDRDLIAQPLYDPRIIAANQIYGGNPTAPWENSQRGYGRGVEIFIQRRNANRISGWVSYAYSVNRVEDGIAHVSYPSDFDLRHSIRVFATYRLRPTINLSSRVIYGTGLPVPGYFQQIGSGIYLAPNRNGWRLPPYQRTDFRINKAFVRKHMQFTLFAEVVNATNYDNKIFEDTDGFNTKTGKVWVTLHDTFPLLPTAGLVCDF